MQGTQRRLNGLYCAHTSEPIAVGVATGVVAALASKAAISALREHHDNGGGKENQDKFEEHLKNETERAHARLSQNQNDWRHQLHYTFLNGLHNTVVSGRRVYEGAIRSRHADSQSKHAENQSHNVT